jgi:hypothetical protein
MGSANTMNTTSTTDSTGATELPAAAPHVIEDEAYPIVETSRLDALYVVTSLLVGGSIELTELLLTRARAWQSDFAASPRLLPMPGDKKADLLRYALIGLIYDGEEYLRQSTDGWTNQLLRTVWKASTLSQPVIDSWLLAPVRQPLKSLSAQMQSDINRWIQRGRVEEGISRAMATEVGDELISFLLDYLSRKPEVRQLIQQQGTTLAEEVVDEVRNQAEAADASVETILRRLFRQAERTPSPPESSTSAK